MTVTIVAGSALPYEREIKDLFLAHERPEFPGFFDRAYPPAFASGATSWLGRDPGGRLVMHIACLPRRFSVAGRAAVGGLLINLMVTVRYRSFFPALALINRVVRDARARGGIDFLYTDPNEESRTLLRGTRFARIGTLRRYVLPIGHRRPPIDLGVRAFHTVLRAAHRGSRAGVVAHPAARFAAERFWAPPAASPRVAAHHDQALYVSRLKGYPGERDWWFTCHRSGGTRRPEAALLVRGPDPAGLATVHAIRWADGSRLAVADLLPGLIAELRRRGCERLQMTTLAESALGRAVRRSGFVPRSDAVPLVALALTPLGEECVAAVKDWEITDLDCDR